MTVSATTNAVAIPGAVAAPDPWGLVVVEPGVLQADVTAAVAALGELPAADRQLLIDAGIKITLKAVAQLDKALMVGAADIGEDETGRTHVTGIRIAAHSRLPLYPIRQIVAHEVGHAMEVIRRQDRSELAAENYVLRVLRNGVDQAVAGQRMRNQGMPTTPSFAPPGLYGSLVQVV